MAKRMQWGALLMALGFTAVAAGRVTIAAGTASADVTVWAGTLPTGRRKALI